MTRFEYAQAAAINEFEADHGAPREWADWEQEYYPCFMAARVVQLLGDVSDPESLADLAELRASVYRTARDRVGSV